MNELNAYYSVIFTVVLNDFQDVDSYNKLGKKIRTLVENQKGFIGFESIFDSKAKKEITISYWKDIESIKEWKQNKEHQKAIVLGKEKWYKSYTVRIAKVEMEYKF